MDVFDINPRIFRKSALSEHQSLRGVKSNAFGVDPTFSSCARRRPLCRRIVEHRGKIVRMRCVQSDKGLMHLGNAVWIVVVVVAAAVIGVCYSVEGRF